MTALIIKIIEWLFIGTMVVVIAGILTAVTGAVFDEMTNKPENRPYDWARSERLLIVYGAILTGVALIAFF